MQENHSRSRVWQHHDLFSALGAALAVGLLASVALMILTLLLSRAAQAPESITLKNVEHSSSLFRAPVDALVPGAPLRYVVAAEEVAKN